ncbi:MAG TPA: beta-ketoacyl-ACP synthase III [Longimicrobiales bacterium]|nr:beta-ketoacyl-ACP synthase III [Longimicrobiales bacterium]
MRHAPPRRTFRPHPRVTEARLPHIAGTGRYLPERVLDNAALAATAGVDDEWIVQRTGIRERRIAAPGEGTAAMATRAAECALRDARTHADEIDLIVVATSTPDHLTPPTACEVQAALGAVGAVCFDLEAGFAGWIFALVTADALLRGGVARRALVIGAETLSTVTNRADPATGPLFGDGAGAAVVEAGPGPLAISSTSWWADGRLAGALVRPGGGARRPFDEHVLSEGAHLLRREGTRLFRQAVRTMAMQARVALDRAGVAAEDVALVVPHQANLRIIQAFAEELGLAPERAFVNIERYGNTGAATVPIALDEARQAGLVPEDRALLLVAFGAGATAGAAVLQAPSWQGRA